jgi:hypothetical protein
MPVARWLASLIEQSRGLSRSKRRVKTLPEGPFESFALGIIMIDTRLALGMLSGGVITIGAMVVDRPI